MFTGIVEEAGLIRSLKRRPNGIRLEVAARRCGQGIKTGASIAVNGCCLTVVRVAGPKDSRRLSFDLLEETWNRTSFAHLQTGSRVNLERAMAANGRFDGHFVSGHIDETGDIRQWDPRGADWLLEIGASPEFMAYVVPKGSVAVDGISLTIATVKKRSFEIWIIPHTRQVTNLNDARVGQRVNLEADLLAKYVARNLSGRTGLKNDRPRRR